MEQKISLLDMFSDFEPKEELRPVLAQTVVCHADLDVDNRRITASLSSEVYITLKQRQDLEQQLAKLYELRKVRLNFKYPPHKLGEMEITELMQLLAEHYPPATATLAGADWQIHEDRIEIQLAGNGVEDLKPHLAHAEQFLKDSFGTDKKLVLVAGKQLEAKELFAETEKLRQEAMKDVPAVQIKQADAPVKKSETGNMIYGKPFYDKPIAMKDVNLNMKWVTVEGEVFNVQHKDLPKRNAVIISFYMTDRTGSVWINQFMEAKEAESITKAVKATDTKRHIQGSYLRIRGKVTMNKNDNEMVVQPVAIMEVSSPQRQDTAEEKRVELHMHTKMSSMDAVTDAGAAVKQAYKWGHRAIAITDHGVAHAFPDAMHAAEACGGAIKVLYGCEGYYVNDVDDRVVVHGDGALPFDGEYVAFDLETTGLSAQNDTIIEFGAVIMKNGEVLERFESFVNPGCSLEPRIVDLTGITDAMLKTAPKLTEVLPKFLTFCGDRPLVAHNADFDIGFITAACERLQIPFAPTYIDTLILAQNLLPKLSKHKLNIVADYLGLPEFNHHRAGDDAIICGLMFWRFAKMLQEQGISQVQQINRAMIQLRSGGRISDRHARHIIVFAKNSTGLRNLYRLISDSNTKYYKRVPRMPKSELLKHREGLIIGSACEAGELFQAILAHKSHAELKRIAAFYDFLEIQPLSNNMFMLENGTVETVEQLQDFNRLIVQLGEEMGKPVVATGDVHFMNPEDEIFRRILLASKGFEDCDRPNPLYFRTTDEMLKEFSYLGEDKAYAVVVTNTNRIADMCETVRPVPHKLFAPKIKNSAEDLKKLVYEKMHRLYGDNPPELITQRVETELGDIIDCHYDVIYMSAQKLVQNSLEHGYLVGSRGSVGSSVVAFLSGITEVNAFPPHYRCPNPACKFTTFDVLEEYNCGADLPDANCPHCGTAFEKDGFHIPFETFLGFGGDKIPDIDLNFSGEYQANAHAYCAEMFGKSHVFRAGTISGVAGKTAFGSVKKYLSERRLQVGKAEEERLVAGCVGVKRTTGQHPGGLVVIPQENEIWDFCPVQHPADDPNSEWITTHFEYHSMEENLLKLDMLGHDDPTMIRMLQDMTGVDPQKISLDDQETMKIFISSESIGYKDDPILGPTGAVGIPEFGTGFTRGMLVETQPKQFDTLLRLSGFSHGENVWLGNARDLILSKTATVGQAIGCRDDIMLYLIKCGIPEKRAFKIMEAVRKGKGLPDGAKEEMSKAGIPDWYIDSCTKIKYLFPKAHAVAYVMMAFRIAWFKVHYPLAFYAAYFYRRSQKGGFDAEMMCKGKQKVLECIKAIQADEGATAKDEDLLTTLEVCYEFYLRGFSFAPLNLYKSDATKFIPTDNQLLPPFVAVSGLGETAAWDIVEGRRNKQFISIEEFAAACPKVSQTHIENLKTAGAFGEMPQTSQISMF